MEISTYFYVAEIMDITDIKFRISLLQIALQSEHKLTKFLIWRKVDWVPLLGFSSMQKVDGEKIQVFFMPSKHWFPTSDIKIGSCYPIDWLVFNSFNQNRVQMT